MDIDNHIHKVGLERILSFLDIIQQLTSEGREVDSCGTNVRPDRYQWLIVAIRDD